MRGTRITPREIKAFNAKHGPSRPSLKLYMVTLPLPAGAESICAVAKTPLEAARIGQDFWTDADGPDSLDDHSIEVNSCVIPESVSVGHGWVKGGGGAIVPMCPTHVYHVRKGRLREGPL